MERLSGASRKLAMGGREVQQEAAAAAAADDDDGDVDGGWEVIAAVGHLGFTNGVGYFA